MIDFSSFILGAAVGFIIFGGGLIVGIIIGIKICEEVNYDELEN